MSNDQATIESLKALISDLSARIDTLENELHHHHPADEVAEEVVLAISAACAAYLGKRAVVKKVRVRRGNNWAAQARSDIHRSHAAFGTR
ncbi:hypothetical protein [Gephyromycinifex aptenodytis]|uniref:hypothetical protein n=1 Tax=Gephyromycinifex aptenodytis TaxID=2716227 RepID=UPI001444E85B|nr:hypothetical protein [Gephyromycinifex aptenodytis]